jgi:hypothetical protein
MKYTVITIAINVIIAGLFNYLFPNTCGFGKYSLVVFVTAVNAIIIYWAYFVLNGKFERFVNFFLISIGLRLTFYGIFIYYIISTENVHLVKLIGAFLISYLIYQIVEIKFFVQTRKSRST